MLRRLVCALALTAVGGLIGAVVGSPGYVLEGAAVGALAVLAVAGISFEGRSRRHWTFRIVSAHLERADGRNDAVRLRMNPDGTFEGLDRRLDLPPGSALRIDAVGLDGRPRAERSNKQRR